ncbi:MAG: DUF4376 domain-containing protein [Alphaproteobacteria bacterium]
MKNFYKDENGTIFDDQSDVNSNWVKMTEDEVSDFLLAQAKSAKLTEIKKCFSLEQENGHTTSSLGFEIDATRLSKDDIESLLYVDMFPVRFRDYDNEFHDLTKEQAETLKKEIIAYGLAVYQKKWELEVAIKNATTIEEVEVIKW